MSRDVTPARAPDWTPGDVIAASPDGTIVLDDGITTWNPTRADAFLSASRGVAAIAAERQRQIKQEGWTPEHDDGHVEEELALVATWLLAPQRFKHFVDLGRDKDLPPSYTVLKIDGRLVPLWGVFKKQSRVEALTKAGALIAAEIDRLERGAA